MGTADYCALVTLLLAGLIALSIRQDDRRRTDRRQIPGHPPGGLERRSGRSRRHPTLSGWSAWAGASQWRKLRRLFRA